MRTRDSLFSNPQLPRTASARARKAPKGVVIPKKTGKRGPVPIVNMQTLGPGVALITPLARARGQR
jgi:hypothetical protein